MDTVLIYYIEFLDLFNIKCKKYKKHFINPFIVVLSIITTVSGRLKRYSLLFIQNYEKRYCYYHAFLI